LGDVEIRNGDVELCGDKARSRSLLAVEKYEPQTQTSLLPETSLRLRVDNSPLALKVPSY
jgi:hypothetical protein